MLLGALAFGSACRGYGCLGVVLQHCCGLDGFGGLGLERLRV